MAPIGLDNIKTLMVTFTRIEQLRIDGTAEPMASPSRERVWRSIMRVLDESPLCACATVADAGEAHIHTAYYAYSDDLDLYFLSHPESKHCRNLRTNASTAAAVFSSAQSWAHADRGLQMFGRCTVIEGAAVETAERVYVERFPPFGDWKAALRRGDAALDYRFYRFQPDSIKVLDEAEFGDAVWITARVHPAS